MRKKVVMSIVRKKRNREIKDYYKYINYLYDMFFNYETITENEKSIFNFILELPISEVERIVSSIFLKLKELELKDALLDKTIFKFAIMFYIQNNKQELEKIIYTYNYE